MKKLILYACLCSLFFPVSLNAQVVVGTDKQPESFSALEIVSTEGGLRHPQMTTAERDALLSSLTTSADSTKAYGLMVYNTDINCLEYFKSRADGWINFCDQQNIIVYPLSADAVLRPWNTATDGLLPSGTTAGKSKYDVATSANSSLEGSCGYVGAGRTGDFNAAADYVRSYVLEFPSNPGTITDLIVGQREYIENMLSVSGAVAGTVNTAATIPVTVTFNSAGANAVKTVAQGTDENSALYTTIYALYKRNGSYERAEYRIMVMDCMGCGVREQTGAKEWIRMGCYNCGVTSASASSNGLAATGGVYQWGRNTDGHEVLTSTVYEPVVAIGEIVYPTAPKDSLNASGQPIGERAGKFIPVTTASQTYFYEDWSAQHDPFLWGDATQNMVVAKGMGDPCPAGFRVPTKSEMEKISAALTWASSAGTAKDDGILTLPAVTSRNTAGTSVSASNYWTSTVYVPSSGTDEKEVYVMTSSGTAVSFTEIGRANGAAVRCVSVESFKY